MQFTNGPSFWENKDFGEILKAGDLKPCCNRGRGLYEKVRNHKQVITNHERGEAWKAMAHRHVNRQFDK
jgi:hypothetical protein